MLFFLARSGSSLAGWMVWYHSLFLSVGMNVWQSPFLLRLGLDFCLWGSASMNDFLLGVVC